MWEIFLRGSQESRNNDNNIWWFGVFWGEFFLTQIKCLGIDDVVLLCRMQICLRQIWNNGNSSYLLSIEMERLLVRVATVSFFSLVIVVSEEEEVEEEEKTEAGELSFTKSERDIKATSRKSSQYTFLEWKTFLLQNPNRSLFRIQMFCLYFCCHSL